MKTVVPGAQKNPQRSARRSAAPAGPNRFPSNFPPRGLGNRRSAAVLQAKLEVGAANDPLEKQADRMAERVLRGESAAGTAQPVAAPGARRKCAGCENEDGLVRRKTDPAAAPATGAAVSAMPQAGGGFALPPASRAWFEPRFGADFSGVRLHTGDPASALSEALGARAFTYGRDIYFNRGEYDPHSARGRFLLGHELAHVVQQGASGNSLIQRLPKVTAGEYGLALDWFLEHHVGDPLATRLVEALRSSRTFMGLARSLDRRVIFPWASSYDFSIDASGWLSDASGNPLNKRSLVVYPSHNGTFYAPHGTPVPGNMGSWDTLYIEYPRPGASDDERIERYAEQIAHETRHALEANTSTHGPAPDAQTAITRSIREEADVRDTEHRVLREIRAARLLPAARPSAGPADTIRDIESGSAVADVERSFVSRRPIKTYLESSLFSFLKGRVLGNTTTDEQTAIMRAIDAMTLDTSVLAESYTLADYGAALGLYSELIPEVRRNVDWATYYLLERLFGMEWEEFQRLGMSSVAEYFDLKEEILQRHLGILQRVGSVSYTARIPHP